MALYCSILIVFTVKTMFSSRKLQNIYYFKQAVLHIVTLIKLSATELNTTFSELAHLTENVLHWGKLILQHNWEHKLAKDSVFTSENVPGVCANLACLCSAQS